MSHTITAPSATAAMVIPVGRDLQDTLLFCLVPQNREIAGADVAMWERSPEAVESLKQGFERSPAGLADRYTWRVRSIRLVEGDAGGIEKLAFASGVGNASAEQLDPMLGYRVDEKKGRLPIQFRERGLWREFDSLLPDASGLAPRVVEHATNLARVDRNRFPGSVIVLGQSNDKAKIEFWRMEHLRLPEALAGERCIRSDIRQLLHDAEEAQRHLWLACRSFARHTLSRGAREPAGKDIGGVVAQMPVIPSYWSTLEGRFHDVLNNYKFGVGPDEIRLQWLKAVRNALNSAWERHATSVSIGDAWAIRALIKAERFVISKKKELDEEITKLDGEKEVP